MASSSLFTDAEMLAWNQEKEIEESERRVAERERAVEEVLSQNLLGKLVMPEDEVIKGKHEHLPESIRKLLWEASLLDFGEDYDDGGAKKKLKPQMLKRRPHEKMSTFMTRINEADEQYVFRALLADRTIPRTPPTEGPGLPCPASSSSSSRARPPA